MHIKERKSFACQCTFLYVQNASEPFMTAWDKKSRGVGIHGTPSSLMKFRGVPWDIPWNSPWGSTEFHGNKQCPWSSVEICGMSMENSRAVRRLHVAPRLSPYKAGKPRSTTGLHDRRGISSPAVGYRVGTFHRYFSKRIEAAIHWIIWSGTFRHGLNHLTAHWF